MKHLKLAVLAAAFLLPSFALAQTAAPAAAARRAADRGAPLSAAAGSSPLSKAVAGLARDHLQALAKPAAARAR